MATPATHAEDIKHSIAENWLQKAQRLTAYFENRPFFILLALGVFYLLLVVPLALIKLLWADEFITYYIAKLGSSHAIWNALKNGADPNPPLGHISALWSMQLFGENAFALRIPAIAACLLCVLALFLYLRKRLPVIFAAAGVCLFMSTAALNYAYEGRSYAFILAFSMLSFYFWTEATDGTHQNLSTVLLALALGAGIASNYFAVLAFFPVAAGELARSLYNRRIELRIWIALFFGALPFLLFLPLINHAIAQFAPHAWNKTKLDVIPDSYTEMVEVVLIPSLGILGLATWSFVRAKVKGEPRSRSILPRHESFAVFVLMSYPILGYVLAKIRGGMMSPRFVLPVCLGFGIATVVAFYRLLHKNAAAASILLLVFGTWAIARDGFCAYDYIEQRAAFNRVLDAIPAANTVVVADSLLVQPLYHYAPPDVASRIVFPIDFPLIQRYKHEDSLEQNYWAGRNIFPVPIVSLKQLRSVEPNYVVVATNGNWLLQKMEVDGSPAKRLPIETHSRDIGGFTPLSHGKTYFFEVGNPIPSNEQYASTRRNSLTKFGRGRQLHGEGMSQ